ncbi:MAG TPA: class I SAM-dependent methyltransferase [Acidimicrobiales bacterium]|nr:class I SAM-dependent methyltransferase [Acidimicrobiales bacterium]
MGDLPDEVRHHYEQEIVEGERLAQGPGRLEFARTQEIIRRHLPPGPLRILDVGGAEGVHAAWLADDGHRVHVVDPMANHVASAGRLAGPGRAVTAEVGDARALPVEAGSADTVLLLGPLYHLTEPSDRGRALAEARRALRPGGLAFVAAISRFASLLDGLSREFLLDPAFRRIVEQDLRDGQHRNPERRPHWFTTTYFHHPDDLRREGEAAGLEVVEVLGVEGVPGWLGNVLDRWDDPDAREAILFAARALEAEPSAIGASAHLLMVCRSPSSG